MPRELTPLALPISLAILCVFYYFVYRWTKKANKEKTYPSATRKQKKEIERLLELDETEMIYHKN